MKNARIAAQNSWQKKQPKNMVLFYPAIKKDVDTRKQNKKYEIKKLDKNFSSC